MEACDDRPVLGRHWSDVDKQALGVEGDRCNHAHTAVPILAPPSYSALRRPVGTRWIGSSSIGHYQVAIWPEQARQQGCVSSTGSLSDHRSRRSHPGSKTAYGSCRLQVGDFSARGVLDHRLNPARRDRDLDPRSVNSRSIVPWTTSGHHAQDAQHLPPSSRSQGRGPAARERTCGRQRGSVRSSVGTRSCGNPGHNSDALELSETLPAITLSPFAPRPR